MPIPQGKVVRGTQVPAAATRLGGPVVLKMMAPVWSIIRCRCRRHRPPDLPRAVAQMRAAVAAHDPRAVTDRFLDGALAPPRRRTAGQPAPR